MTAVSSSPALSFEIRDAEEGGYYTARSYPVFTPAETWDELRANVPETNGLHFENSQESPQLIPLYYVRDEWLRAGAA